MAQDSKAQPAKPEELSDGEMATVAGGSTGAGAGKVIFNPFSITRKVDRSSP